LVNISRAFLLAPQGVAVKVSSRRPLVAANWKMNGSKSLAKLLDNALLHADLRHVDVVICPPFPYLGCFEHKLTLGAQNVSEFASGAHTGEISTAILQEFSVKYVIVGHSERRTEHHESNELVASKALVALEAGLIPIVCIGESESVRDSGELFTFLAAQLDAVMEKLGVARCSDIILAYEPIWAIGTGKTASPEQAQEVHQFIRTHIGKQDKHVAAGMRILYGGSVKGSNAADLFGQQDVDGGLIGGASLDPDDFLKICQAAK
jgi:triosephosphate isomerase (TIM)